MVIKQHLLAKISSLVLLLLAMPAIGQDDPSKQEYDSAMMYQDQGLFEKSLPHFNKALNNPTLDDKFKAEVYNNLAFSAIYSSKKDSALWYAKTSLNLYQLLGDLSGQSDALVNLGTVWFNLSQFDSAIFCYFKALTIDENQGVTNGAVLENIGLIYERQSNDSLARVYYLKALEIARSKQDSSSLAAIYTNLAILESNAGNHTSAIDYYKQSIRISQGQNDSFKLAIAYLNLGITLMDTDDFEGSVDYFLKSGEKFAEAGDMNGVAYAYMNLGASYGYLSNRKESSRYLNKAIALADSNDYKGTLLEALSQFSTMDSLFGDYKAAYLHYKQYAALERELAVEEKLQEIQVAQSEFDLALKEKENKILQSDIETQSIKISKKNTQLYASMGVFILLIGFGYYWFTQNQKKKKTNDILRNQNHRIETLMRELHHRVKNNLQVISSLLGLQSMKLEDPIAKEAVLEGKNRVKAMSMIHQKLYQDQEVSQLDFKSYVEDLVDDLKNSYMPDDDVEINLTIPDLTLDIEKTIPLGLILNELITNSFKYAFQEIEKPLIQVELINNGNDYQLNVSDNGQGVEKELHPEKVTSFGLRLVNLLVKQLGGVLSTNQTNGLMYEIKFTHE